MLSRVDEKEEKGISMKERSSYSALLEEVGELKRSVVHVYPPETVDPRFYDCKSKEHLVLILKQYSFAPDTLVKVFPDVKNVYTGLLSRDYPVSGILEHFWRTNVYNYREGDPDICLYAGEIGEEELRKISDLYELCNLRVENTSDQPFHFLLCNHDRYYKAWHF